MDDKEKESLLRAYCYDAGVLYTGLDRIKWDNNDDLEDLRHHIHAIQNIIYTQLYIDKHGKV